ncbi:MAG TPA: hypothetical protein VFA59_05575 [Vicinamibacterales bacterium]|nr:hypothetical protein [Vicinamibacterales bacterium]
MTARTRYFVIISTLVLTVGVGTGLVAYYVGFPAGAFGKHPGPEELQYIPRDAAVIAYANVQEVMHSDLRQRLHKVLPAGTENGQAELQNLTGINIETDIFRIVACMYPDASAKNTPGEGMVLARGNFDEAKIEALMRDHGAHVEDYKGKRLIVSDTVNVDKPRTFALSFIEPGLVALGTGNVIHAAIDLHNGGDNPQTGTQSVTGNEELMTLVNSLDTGNNAWAVGRFDALTANAKLPANISSQIPAITWFSVATHINGGLRGTLRAETRDEEAANNLRDVVRGFLALGKMSAGARPEMQAMMSSLQLGGDKKTVALSFDVPAAVFDAIGAIHHDAR